MKITIVSSLPPIKGISLYTTNLLDELSKIDNLEILGFNNIYPEKFYKGGTKDSSKPYYNSNISIKNVLNWYNPFGWVFHALRINGDIVHAQWWSYALAPTYYIVLSIAKYYKRKKIVLTIHNVTPHEKSIIKNFLNKAVIKLGDKYIVHNARNKESLSKLHGIREEHIEIIPHGILRPPTKSLGISKNQARVSLGVPKNDIVLLFFGIIRDYKGVDVLLRTFNKIAKNHDNYTLIIAGKPWSEWSGYSEIMTSKAKCKTKLLLEYIPNENIEPLFVAADFAVFPYKYFDSQTGAGNLALYYNKPLIVSEVGGLTELVKSKRQISKPGDESSLLDSILLSTQNQETIETLTKQTKEISKDLSWSKIAKSTSKVYKKLI